eukprot:ANDGO_07286.mRNA.1 Putative metal ion transporter C17A12.14
MLYKSEMAARCPGTDREEAYSPEPSGNSSQRFATLSVEGAVGDDILSIGLATEAIHDENPALSSFRSSTTECSSHSPKMNRRKSSASVLHYGGIDFDDTFATLLAKGLHVMYLSSSFSEPLFHDSCRSFMEAHSELLISCTSDHSSRVCHWIDVQTMDSSDFQILGLQLSLHELTMEDCLDFDEVEKFETFPIQNYSHSSVLVHGLQDEDFEHCVPVHFILKNHIVITVHAEPISCFCTVLARLRFKRFDQPFDILYSVLDVFVDEAIPLTDQILSECECIEELVFSLSESEHSDLLLRISNSRKQLVMLRRLLTGKQKIVSQLSSAKWKASGYIQQDGDLMSSRSHANLFAANNFGSVETSEHEYPVYGQESSDNGRLYLRDLQDHIGSCLHKMERSREMLTQAHSNYLSRMSIAVARTSQVTNNWMKKLGIVATGMLPLTIVTSAFGMNVQVPWRDVDSLDPFFGILAVTCAVAFTLTGVYVYRTYLQDRPGGAHALLPPV